MAKKSQEPIQSEAQLTPDELEATLEFAQYLYQPMAGQNMYTPQMLYQNLLNLNVLPEKTDYEKMVKALENARENAQDIQGYSQFLENMNMIYKRTLEYYTNLLSFDMYWDVVEANKMEAKDWDSNEYKQDLERLYKFIDNFDYKQEFRNILLNMLRREVVYTWFRQNEPRKGVPKYTLQTMPQSRFMMTGYWECGILADFDMQYFLQPSVDINAYDPKFKEIFVELWGGNGKSALQYNPTNPLNRRDGSFATWVQTSPDDGQWTFKFNNSTFEMTPFLTPFIKDSLYANDIQKLQRDKDVLSAFAILAGEIGMIDKSQSGNTQNQTAFTAKVMGNFMSIARTALANTKIKPVALPLEEVEWRQFEDKNPNMYSNSLKAVSGLGASANRVIYSDDKASQHEIESQIIADYCIVKRVYSQFEKFMNFWINKKMRHYHFKIHFDGCSQPFERKKRIDNVKIFMDVGLVPNESYIASLIGIDPQTYSRMLSESKNGGLKDKTILLESIHTASGKQGRPEQQDVTGSSREYDNSNE